MAAGALAVVALVLAGVCVQQARFDPAVMVAAVAPAAAAAPAGLLGAWPAGLLPMSGAEAFTTGTLSDKIDGKADLYLSAGFVSLRSQRLSLAGAPGSWMEMLVYDMGLPANAFSVYSSQRRPNGADAGMGDYSYEADNELCLVHGKYYVEVVCSDPSDTARRAAEALARAYVGSTAVAEHANIGAEQALFPAEGLIAGSIALVPSDVFGLEGLRNVFVARYRDGGGELALFAARRDSPGAAAREASALRTFFVGDCGGKEAPAPPSPPGAAIIEMDGSFEAVFSSGPYLAGVHQAPDREAAQRWLGVISRRIAGARP
jgi:hypothetical protein